MSDRNSKRKEIVKLLQEGKGVTEIAGSLGVSKSYVSRVKKDYTELLLRSRGELEAEVFTLLEEGKDPVAIVKELKIPSDTVVEIYNKYLELKGLPEITVFDLSDEIESLSEELHGLKRTIGKLGFQLSKETEEKLNSQYKAVNSNLSTLNKRVESLENYTTTLQGTMNFVVSLLGMPLIDCLLQKLILAPGDMGEVISEHDYAIVKEWAALTGALWKAQKTTGKGHISGEVITHVLELASTYRDALQLHGDSQGAQMLDDIIKLLKYGPSTGRHLPKNIQK